MAIPQPVPEPVVLDRAVGDRTGMTIPAHAEALLKDGAAWLTAAFRRFGSLGPAGAQLPACSHGIPEALENRRLGDRISEL